MLPAAAEGGRVHRDAGGGREGRARAGRGGRRARWGRSQSAPLPASRWPPRGALRRPLGQPRRGAHRPEASLPRQGARASRGPDSLRPSAVAPPSYVLTPFRFAVRASALPAPPRTLCTRARLVLRGAGTPRARAGAPAAQPTAATRPLRLPPARRPALRELRSTARSSSRAEVLRGRKSGSLRSLEARGPSVRQAENLPPQPRGVGGERYLHGADGELRSPKA